MTTKNAPVEAKVKAATGAGVVVAFLVGLISHDLLNDGAVPEAVVDLISAGVTGLGTFIAGWMAKHTHRSKT